MRSSTRGFTLIELVVTVTVLAILAAIATPSFIDFMHRNQVATQSNAFLGTLRLARTTAITRNTFVSVCPTLDASVDNPACAVSSDYSTGYLVYTSTSAGKTFTAGDELIRASQATPGVSLRAPDANKVLTFSARGASTAGTLSLLLCARRGGEATGESTLRVSGRRFDIQASGRAGLVELPTSASPDAAASYCTPPS
ncbi:GspH/FimT family pseudopilin [Luteibacter sp. NPDC031894]|uniref:GspH/FimT family pseudopilin n=1 Tax=Luteibacter sp. NPDC031894 TaxID=3390572 RepID=UPI003D071E5D